MSGGTQSIVGLGAVVVDHQMMLDQIPAENEKERAHQYREQIGGPVPTALVVLRRLGFSCRLLSAWGTDTGGLAIENDLANEGVAWGNSCRSSQRTTAVAHVWTSTVSGSRTIVAGPVRWSDFELSENDCYHLSNCDLLHLDGHGGTVAVEAARLVAENGGRVTVDAGAPKSATEELIPLADVFSFPERFAEQFFGEADIERAGAAVLKRGAKAAVCTRGEKGAVLFEPQGVTRIPAFSVSTADSTGAGDVFCGGMVAGLLQGLALPDAARTGAAAAAVKCRRVGNRSPLPSWDELNMMLRTGSAHE